MMIRVIFKTVAIVVLVVAGLSYVSYLKTGRFTMPIAFSKPDLQIPKISPPPVPMWGAEKTAVKKDQTVKKETAYKWQDSSGKWHYTTDPPGKGIAYEKIKALP